MRPDGYGISQGQLQGPAHGISIACMITAGNIGGTYIGHDRFVAIHPFTHIAIEVYAQHTSSFK
jgi:hypothetical protein